MFFKKLKLYYEELNDSELILYLKEIKDVNTSINSSKIRTFSSIIFFNNLIISNKNIHNKTDNTKIIHSNIFLDYKICGKLETNINLQYNNILIQKKFGIRNEDNIGYNLRYMQRDNKETEKIKSISIDKITNFIDELKNNVYEIEDFNTSLLLFLNNLNIKHFKYEEEILFVQLKLIKLSKHIITTLLNYHIDENNLCIITSFKKFDSYIKEG